MKLQLRDIESDIVERNDPLDMIQRSMEIMGDNLDDDDLLQWIRPVHLDDENRNPDPRVASQAREEGVDVDHVLSEDVDPTSYGSSDDGPGSNDGGGDGDGGDIGGVGATQEVGRDSGGLGATREVGGGSGGRQRYEPWTMEEGFQATQDEDHGARRQREGEYFDFETNSYYGGGTQRGAAHYMSSGTEYSGSYQGHGSYVSSGSEYGVEHLMSQMDTMSFTSDTQSDGSYTCPSYHYPNPTGVPQPQVNPQGSHRRIFGIRVDRYGAEHVIACVPGCPLISAAVGYDQADYDRHVQNFERSYKGHFTWCQYCELQENQPSFIQPGRPSGFEC